MSSLKVVHSEEPEHTAGVVEAVAKALSAALLNRGTLRKEILDILSGRRRKTSNGDDKMGRFEPSNALGGR